MAAVECNPAPSCSRITESLVESGTRIPPTLKHTFIIHTTHRGSKNSFFPISQPTTASLTLTREMQSQTMTEPKNKRKQIFLASTAGTLFFTYNKLKGELRVRRRNDEDDNIIIKTMK